MLAFPKRYGLVNEVRVAHYDQGDGPAIVLLHGFGTSCFLWRDVVANLRRGFRVVAPDLLGLGDSAGSLEADHSLHGQALLVEGLLERLEIDEAVLVGHDIGGAVAQLLALSGSRRVRGLALVASAAYDNWPVSVIRKLQRVARYRSVWRLALRAGLTRRLGLAANGYRRGVKYPGSLTDVEIEEYLRPHRLSTTSQEHLRLLLLALDNRDTQEAAESFGTLRMPKLVVWGADDAFLEPTWAKRLAAELPGARLQLLNDCGHFIPEERPGELSGLLDHFAQECFDDR